MARRWRRRHHHHWRKQFDGVWDLRGGYFDCEGCEAREVGGNDCYGYTAWQWIKDGTAPPPSFLAELGNKRAQGIRHG